MTTINQMAFDESTLGRVYTWLLSLNDGHLAARGSDEEQLSDKRVAATNQALSNDTVPQYNQS